MNAPMAMSTATSTATAARQPCLRRVEVADPAPCARAGVGDDRHDGDRGEDHVADERLGPGGLGVQRAEAVAVRCLAARHRNGDRDDERGQQDKREIAPACAVAGKSSRPAAVSSATGECHADEAERLCGTPNPRAASREPLAIEQLADAGDGEDGEEDEACGEGHLGADGSVAMAAQALMVSCCTSVPMVFTGWHAFESSQNLAGPH